MNTERIILTGATGFVGGHVYAALEGESREIVCTSRNPDRASRTYPERRCTWAKLDVDDPQTIESLLRSGDRIFYLIHEMGTGGDYEQLEQVSARAFGRIAREAGAARIVYLGGTKPQGTPSKHLASRLRTGKTLRHSGVPTVELRASMIIGSGSESWQIARDLAVRLPAMLTPKWLDNLCEPIAIEDVVAALIHALDNDDAEGAYALPGPEVLSFADVLLRIARQRNAKPIRVPVPILTPKLSSHWLRFVTRANLDVARELVEGLKTDLVSPDEGYWKEMPDHQFVDLDTAIRRALDADRRKMSKTANAAEDLIGRLTPSAR
jgi:uncharacterized protein YbjT (DUF2867 family)